MLADAAMLDHPRKDAALRITTDASNAGVGAVLEQQHETLAHVWEPMAFYSRAFNARERNWAPFDMELCAIHDAVKKFAVDTNGCPKLTIYTDHKPIVRAIKKPGWRITETASLVEGHIRGDIRCSACGRKTERGGGHLK